MVYERSESSIQEEARQNRNEFIKILAYSALYCAAVWGLCYGCNRLADSRLPAEIRQPVDRNNLPSKVQYESPHSE